MPLVTPQERLMTLTNDQVASAYIALGLACGRSKSVVRNKHRTYFCFLLEVLGAELDRRGRDRPARPFVA